jgi:hypothetical protein
VLETLDGAHSEVQAILEVEDRLDTVDAVGIFLLQFNVELSTLVEMVVWEEGGA